MTLGRKLAETGISGVGVTVGNIGVLVGTIDGVGDGASVADGLDAASTCSPLLNMEKDRVSLTDLPFVSVVSIVTV